jgi:hypothetical protein
VLALRSPKWGITRGGITSTPPIKITAVDLRDHSLIVEVDVNGGSRCERRTSGFDIKTEWRSASVDGGTIRQIAGNLYRVDLDRGERERDSFGYTHRRVVVHFEHAD